MDVSRPGQTWRTSCSSNSPMSSTCKGGGDTLGNAQLLCVLLERGDQQEAQLLKGRPAAGPQQMQCAGSSHRSVIAYGPVLMMRFHRSGASLEVRLPRQP